MTGHENVWVNYELSWWKSGHRAQIAWGRGRAAYFSLLAQPAAVRRGMVGMRPGGRRTIVMPVRIADVHEEHGRNRSEAGVMDVVLRGIVE